MLLEGVDLPAATTAFLGRPTTSRVLMRQMIGRVLRGPRAGGSSVAHIVDLRDQWQDEIDVLGPVDIPGQPPVDRNGSIGGELPPIRDNISGNSLPQDVENAVRRVLAARYATAAKASLRRVELVGFLELADRNVPVFAHARDRWDLLLSSPGGDRAWKRSPLELFDDVAPPQPTDADARAVVDFLRSTGTRPPLVEFTSTLDLRAIAEGLRARGPLDEQQRLEHLRGQYESTLARVTYPTLDTFQDAVHRELVQLQELSGGTRSDPEHVKSLNQRRPAEFLLADEGRMLGPLLESAIRRGRVLLSGADDAVYGWILDHHPPEAEWTLRPVSTSFAHWAPRLHGRKKGTPVIRVNVVLKAPPHQVPDELLEYLLWHELCHHLLPMRGHDSEFRRLEQLWPRAVELDHQLDTLAERYDFGAAKRDGNGHCKRGRASTRSRGRRR